MQKRIDLYSRNGGFRSRKLIALFAVGVFCFCTEVLADMDLRIHGFADLVASKTSAKYSLNGLGNRGQDFNYDSESRLGLNLSADLSDEFVLASQIVGRGSDSGRYTLQADWIFATYKPSEHFAVRAGRQVSPMFLYSEQIDVGFTYMWARIPAEVYSVFPTKSFSGLALFYKIPVRDMSFQIEIFGGGGDVVLEGASYTLNASAKNTKGIELSLTGQSFKFRTGYNASSATGTIVTQVPISGGPPGIPTYGTAIGDIDLGTYQVATAGASYDAGRLILISELSGANGSGSLIRRVRAGYLSVGYHLLSKFIPYATYSFLTDLEGSAYLYPDPTVSTTRKEGQQSSMIGLSYRISPTSVLKGEYMRTNEFFQDSGRDLSANTFTATLDMVF